MLYFTSLFYLFILHFFINLYLISNTIFEAQGRILPLLKIYDVTFVKVKERKNSLGLKIILKGILEGLIYASIAASFTCFANEIT